MVHSYFATNLCLIDLLFYLQLIHAICQSIRLLFWCWHNDICITKYFKWANVPWQLEFHYHPQGASYLLDNFFCFKLEKWSKKYGGSFQSLFETWHYFCMSVITWLNDYRTRANKGRACCQKFFVFSLRLPHTKRIKKCA